MTIRDVPKMIDKWLPSWAVLVSSAWAAWVLWTPPSNFAAFPKAFALAYSLPFSCDMAWASFITLATILHVAGLCLFARHHRDIARPLAWVGLSFQGFFWWTFGFSTLYGNPDTLFGIPGGVVIGAMAFWRAARVGWAEHYV